MKTMTTTRRRRTLSGTTGRHQRRLTVLVAILAMVLGLAGAAQAGGYEDGSVELGGRFYGDFDKDVLLFSGGTADQFCEYDEPTHDARVFHRQDGTTVKKVDGSVQPIYLYSTELGAPEFLDAHCPNPPGLFAVGEGVVTIRQHWSADGPPLRLKNQTIGSVTSLDGSVTWRVRGWADLTFIDGVPQGTPETFQGLQLTQTGQ